jgi:drug/metabolite transporter (DMT)-like permease
VINAKDMSENLKAAAAALITVLLWGSAFPGIEAGLEAYGPGQLALLRYLFASATMAVIALFRPFNTPRVGDLPGLVVLGVLGFAVYHSALNYGQVTVTAGSASFLVETAPVFATLMAVLFLGERLTGWGWVGVLVSFGGAALIALGESKGLRLNSGALLVMLAALSGAGYFTLQKSYLERYSPLALTSYALWAGTLMMGVVWGAGLPEQVTTAPLNATLAVAYIGVLPGALAYVTYAYVLSRLPLSQTASLLYLVPLAALPVAWVWHGEVPHVTALIGGVVLLAGVGLVQRNGVSATAGREPTPTAEPE